MISQEKVRAIMELHREGVLVGKIAKLLNIDRKTVRGIIKKEGVHQRKKRADKIVLEDEIVIKTFNRCNGWGERAHEEVKKMGIEVSYSTFMRKVKELGLKDTPKKFSTPVPDEPGKEFQHDLSLYNVKIGEKKIKLQASFLNPKRKIETNFKKLSDNSTWALKLDRSR